MKAEQAAGPGGKLLQQAVLQHGPGALRDLLGGLEQENHVSRQRLTPLGQQPGRAPETGGMKIVPAAVHHAGDLRPRSFPGGLLLGDGVDVGAQGDRGAWPAAPQQGGRAGGHAKLRQLQAQAGQARLQKRRGTCFLKAQLRMPVQVVLQRPELRQKPPGVR